MRLHQMLADVSSFPTQTRPYSQPGIRREQIAADGHGDIALSRRRGIDPPMANVPRGHGDRHRALGSHCVGSYHESRWVQPVKRYEGDSFVAAFTRASDAAACALDLQRTSLAPIRLRIGLHTGEVQLRDELYVGPTINRTARLRDLAHGVRLSCQLRQVI